MAITNISIIIPTRHREEILWATVEKAVESVKDKGVEVIIINDGDNDLIVPDRFKKVIQVHNNPLKGVSSARNFGAANAKGSVFFFIDDDMWIVPEVIEWIAKQMAEEINTHAVYNINWQYPPLLQEKLAKSKIGNFIQEANYNCMWGRMQENGEQPLKGLYLFDTVASCSLVIHKNVFNKLGGYNEQLIFQGEDRDLSNRLNSYSIPIYAVFDITLFHNHQDRLEINGFLQRLQSGYLSEFKASELGILQQTETVSYTGPVKIVFDFFRITESGWIFLHKSLPNLPLLRPLNNKLIGTLAGLQRYKEWRKTLGK